MNTTRRRIGLLVLNITALIGLSLHADETHVAMGNEQLAGGEPHKTLTTKAYKIPEVRAQEESNLVLYVPPKPVDATPYIRIAAGGTHGTSSSRNVQHQLRDARALLLEQVGLTEVLDYLEPSDTPDQGQT